jgi:deoxyribodipyrimidine photo-lyase
VPTTYEPTHESGLVWFRRDLRLDDNPAWAKATASSSAFVTLFLLDPRLAGRAGRHRRDQLLANLHALDHELQERGGGRLLVRVGDPVDLVAETVRRHQPSAVWWNADVTPFASARDRHVEDRLEVPCQTSYGSLVHAPGDVLTRKGTLSRVFTPFFRAWQRTERRPWPDPGTAAVLDLAGDPLPEPGGEPPMPGGERKAQERLENFGRRVDDYGETRNRPDLEATSMLSADLKFGTLSPRTVADVIGTASAGREAFVRQLAWRDWYAHLLAEIPTLPDLAMKERYEAIAWRDDAGGFERWVEGMTGYPIVDAGMRQLRATGWMHNRVRLICASFLVKNLLIDWRRGERYFRHVLVDGDVAQNAGNWQWVAGTGPDASPYNRIFNPILQGRRFDPDGSYVGRWVPELQGLDAGDVHAPWESPPMALAAAGVTLGDDYPEPIVDLAESRERALAAYAAAGESGPSSRSEPADAS